MMMMMMTRCWAIVWNDRCKNKSAGRHRWPAHSTHNVVVWLSSSLPSSFFSDWSDHYTWISSLFFPLVQSEQITWLAAGETAGHKILMNDILPFSNIEIIISIRQWSRFDFLLEGVATLLFLNDSSRYILSNFLGGWKNRRACRVGGDGGLLSMQMIWWIIHLSEKRWVRVLWLWPTEQKLSVASFSRSLDAQPTDEPVGRCAPCWLAKHTLTLRTSRIIRNEA